GGTGGDTERCRALSLPLAPEAIVALPVEELRAALGRAGSSGAQLALARDIRRRGRNKAAAQRCRRRRLEALEGLRAELGRLGRERERLLRARGLAQRALGTLRGELERVTRQVMGALGDG
ncbi:NFE2 factor, partial [Pachycephala philippinensis]|nr:NFE2 factor [Pachycephala philippinensis]